MVQGVGKVRECNVTGSTTLMKPADIGLQAPAWRLQGSHKCIKCRQQQRVCGKERAAWPEQAPLALPVSKGWGFLWGVQAMNPGIRSLNGKWEGSPTRSSQDLEPEL